MTVRSASRPRTPVCAVTGAGGYVGSRIAAALSAQGWGVVALGRRAGEVPWSLEGGLAAGTLVDQGVTALVHCAYDFSARGWERIREVNVEGTRRLLASALTAGVERLVLISSTAAFAGCRSLYGRAKLETERVAAGAGAFLVRPGLVCGRTPGGMVGTLVKVLRRSPVVPLIGDGRTPIHTVHEDDLCALVLRLLDGAATPDALRGEPITAATEQSVEFRELLHDFARREGRSVTLVPLPWRLVWLGIKALEVARVPIGLRSDSVVSFVNTDPHPDFTGTRRTGVALRPFSLDAAR